MFPVTVKSDLLCQRQKVGKLGMMLDWILGGRILFEAENPFPRYNPYLPRGCYPNVEAGKEGAGYDDEKEEDVASQLIMEKSSKPCTKRPTG